MANELQIQSPTTHALAILSLVLSILGLIGVLPLVGAIGGIVTGRIARQEILDKPELYTGDGIAQAGVMLGWIGVGLALVMGCFIMLLLLLFVPFRLGIGFAALGLCC